MTCPHRPPCPGCPRYGEVAPPPEAVTRLEALAREAGAPPLRVEWGEPGGFRHRVRLAVRGRARSPKIGLFQAGSHRIVDIPRCELHHPALNAMAAELKAALRETDTAPYADAPHRGAVRYVQGVVQRSDGRVQVVVVGNEAAPKMTVGLLERLEQRLGDRLHGLFFNGQPERSNAILGPHWQHMAGQAATHEHIGGASVFFPPGAFGQANLELADRLVAGVHAHVPDGARVLECYAGTGAIGLGLAGRVARLAMNERSPHGLAGLRLGIDALGADARARVQVIEGSADATVAALSGARGPDVVIVDPPRRGLDAGLRTALGAHPPERLVYVSCDLDSFLDDAQALLEAGRFTLAALEAWAFFPFTDHVEVCARFDAAR